METDKCLKDYSYQCERIAVCVDNLLTTSKHPKGLACVLANKHKFKLKGTYPESCHLDFDFGRDDDGTLRFSPRKHVDKIIDCHASMFGSTPKLNVMSPLEKGDRPELEASDRLDQDFMQKYQSLAGFVQFAASLGGLDASTVVLTLASF